MTVSVNVDWANKKLLTIEQVAIFACGGDPENEKFIEKNKKYISFIEADLITAVRNDIEIIRKLIESGYNRLDDKHYDFEDACCQHGVDFYESLKMNDFAVLNKNIHPTNQSIKLNIKEIKSWLSRHEINSEFVFPELSHKKANSSVLDKRIAKLKELTSEYRKHVLEGMTRIEVWELLHAKDNRLFKKFDNAEGGSVKELFDNQSILIFSPGRPYK